MPCVSAYQASDYGTNYCDGLDTTAAAQTARSEQSSMGYSATYNGNAEAADAYYRLGSDNVFFFDGHGDAGRILFKKNCGTLTTITASNPNFYRISSFTSGQLNDVALAVYMACNTANTDSTNGNLLAQSTARGVDTAIGFSQSIYSTQSAYWSNQFWYYLDNGYTVSQAAGAANADNQAYFGYWNQGGMDYNVIQGNNYMVIDPARAGY
ncbi:MAG: hypothetical protein Q7J03_05665 [Methanoregula sp.]|nr:hypothetical protein [Methanoregula sp.]